MGRDLKQEKSMGSILGHPSLERIESGLFLTAVIVRIGDTFRGWFRQLPLS